MNSNKVKTYQEIDPTLELAPAQQPLVEQLVAEIESLERKNLPRMRRRTERAAAALRGAVSILLANTPPPETELIITLGNDRLGGWPTRDGAAVVGPVTWRKMIQTSHALGHIKLNRAWRSGCAVAFSENIRRRLAA